MGKQQKLNVKLQYDISNLDYSKVRVRNLYTIEIYRKFDYRGKVSAHIVVIETDSLYKQHEDAKYDSIVNDVKMVDDKNVVLVSEELNGVLLTIKLSKPSYATPLMDRGPFVVEFSAVSVDGIKSDTEDPGTGDNPGGTGDAEDNTDTK